MDFRVYEGLVVKARFTGLTVSEKDKVVRFWTRTGAQVVSRLLKDGWSVWAFEG